MKSCTSSFVVTVSVMAFAVMSVPAHGDTIRGMQNNGGVTRQCRVGDPAEVINTMHRKNNNMYIGQRGTIRRFIPSCGGCNSRGCYEVSFGGSPRAANFCREHVLCGAVNPPPGPAPSDARFAFGNAVSITNTNDVRNSHLIGRTGKVQSSPTRCQGCTCYAVRLDPNSFLKGSPQPDFMQFCESDLRCIDSQGCGGSGLPMPTATSTGNK